MKNNTNQTNQKLTAAERAEMEAKRDALRLEAKKLNAFLKKDAEMGKEEVNEATQLSIQEVETVAEVTEETPVEEEVTEEVTETPVEEEEVAEEVTETLVEEEEVTEEVTETPVEEEEVTEEVTETPVEEEEVAEEVTETSEEEEEVAEEVTETPVEEEEVTEEVTETSEEEEVEESEGNEDNTSDNKKSFKNILIGALTFGLCICLIALIAMAVRFSSKDGTAPIGDETIDNVTTTAPTDSTTPADPVDPVDPAFDMDAFIVSVQNIAKTLTTDEDIAANVDVFVENIVEDKLKELIGEHGELPVQKAIAEFIAFVPEIKMNQYISNNGLAYNPNATDDYYQMLDDAEKAYAAATGKNPNGALMSLNGYDIHKSNREAMKALINETGDTALLVWYEAKTTGYDNMAKQNRDTEVAKAYKEEVKLELVNSKGAIDLIELQLEKEANGELTVMDNVSMQYTEAYNQFILNNYMYVVVK